MSTDTSGSRVSSRKPGEYVVVARRYRPQTFQELVGQNQVSQALANAINTNRVGHAYLFTGARGVGKTSTARIFAKALDCQLGPTPTPCNQCDICRGIATGEDVDVLEIDGASNRGIDEIRQLRSNVNIRPSRARFKIYIIDEVHMLTLPAFNALLKTLEEPPEHVKFIFCTTDPEKIPITIISRCQRFDFPPVETKSIVDRLRLIVNEEKVGAEEEALHLLARRANGSLRDSQSLLEQLLSSCPTQITVQDVHAMLGTARGGQITALAAKLIGRDAAGALQELEVALTEGVDPGQLTEQLVGYFRDMLAAAVGCGPDLMLHTPPAHYAELQASGQQLGLETLLAMVQILDQAISRMRHSTHVRTLLEVALIRIARLENLDELANLLAEVRLASAANPSAANPSAANPSGPGAVRPAGPSRTSVARPSTPAPPTAEKKKDMMPARSIATSQNEEAEQPAGFRQSSQTSEVLAPGAANLPNEPRSSLSTTGPSTVNAADESTGDLSAEDAEAIWREALNSLGDMTADFARRAVRVQPSGPNRLVARFSADYNLHKEHCERPERRTKLEAALAKAAGRTIRLDLELVSNATQAEPRLVPVQTHRQRMQERQRHPLVRRAIEMFDAEVLRVDEPRVGTDDRSTS